MKRLARLICGAVKGQSSLAIRGANSPQQRIILSSRSEINLDGFDFVVSVFVCDLGGYDYIGFKSIGQTLRRHIAHNQRAYVLPIRYRLARPCTRNQTG